MLLTGRTLFRGGRMPAAVLASDLTLGRREESCVDRLLSSLRGRGGRRRYSSLVGPSGSLHMAGTIAGPELAATSHWPSDTAGYSAKLLQATPAVDGKRRFNSR